MDQPRKLFIQMSGAPGSGKSTIAKLLAQAINGVVINHDLIKTFFLENGTPFAHSSTLTYRLDWLLAEDLIQQGRSLILDTPCNHREILDHGTALARRYAFVWKYVECRVDDIDLLDRRLQSRPALRSQRTRVDSHPSDVASSDDPRALFRSWIEDPCRPAAADVIVVDSSSMSPQECVDLILARIAPSC